METHLATAVAVQACTVQAFALQAVSPAPPLSSFVGWAARMAEAAKQVAAVSATDHTCRHRLPWLKAHFVTTRCKL